MAKKKNTPLVTATVRGHNLQFKCPTVKQWSRYVEKAKDGKHSTGKRELLQVTCVSHEPDEAREILNKAPAAIAQICAGVEELSGGDLECSSDGEKVDVLLGGVDYVVESPDIDSWESFQDRAQQAGSRLYDEILKTVCELCTDPDGLKSAFTQYPGAANVVFDEVSSLAGTEVEVVVKKG